MRYILPSTVTDEDIAGIPQVLNIKGSKADPQFDLYIGRQCNMGGWKLSKSKWFNPYKGDDACGQYYMHILNSPELMGSLIELKGMKLGCWCDPKPCHGHVLQHIYIQYVLHGVPDGVIYNQEVGKEPLVVRGV